ncbi:MAG: hypothetical protein IKK41_00135 [Oscillospiraceae bacterium]|nr:hypothetical protein [Oscillospiraceae bacterium]
MIRNLLVLPSGEELFSGQAGENAICDVTVTRCVNTEDELMPGAVCAGMLEASVIAEKPLNVAAGEEVTLYTVSDTGARRKEGIFIAEKPVWESANRYKLTAYDRISRLDKDLTGWLANLSGWPYGLLDFAGMVCAECGLELITQEIPNGDYPVQAFSGEGVTGRQLISWVGQASCRFCRATPDGQMEFAWYEKTGKTIGSGEKIIQAGPDSTVILEDMRKGDQLQAISEIKHSLSTKNSVKLFQKGKNILDLQTVGIYHSNQSPNIRHKMTLTDTGFRLDVTKSSSVPDRSLWGFCLGTAEELAGKTITASAVFSTSKTGQYATPYLSFFGIDTEPVYDPRTVFASYIGGCISGESVQQLAFSGGADAKSVTYTVTGNETKKYIAILFTLGNPQKNTTSAGDWAQWDNIQVEYADAATAYAPYTCNEFSRTVPAVCGGRLNWNTGELTVTHGRISSYAGEIVPDGWKSSTGKLSTGALVTYPLETPYTVWLTPQLIFALEGRNYLWSNVDNTTAGFHQDYYFLGSLSYEDYQTAPVEKVQIRRTDTDVGAVYPDDPGVTNAYILSGNYLLTNGQAETLETVAQELYAQVKDIAYTPCRLEIPASAGVRAGDVVSVTDKNGKEITVYVMRHTRSGQRDTLECTGSPRRDSSTAVNNQSYKALSGKVLNLRTDVEGLKVENADAAGKVAGLMLSVDNIKSSVEKQQASVDGVNTAISQLQQTAGEISATVKSIQDNGVTKVTNEFGLTIDESAIEIHRNTSEMTNRLNEKGMYVVRNAGTEREVAMLQADADGVIATDVKVNNYLIIGTHARFEDYNDGSDSKRTACFYLGGS